MLSHHVLPVHWLPPSFPSVMVISSLPFREPHLFAFSSRKVTFFSPSPVPGSSCRLIKGQLGNRFPLKTSEGFFFGTQGNLAISVAENSTCWLHLTPTSLVLTFLIVYFSVTELFTLAFNKRGPPSFKCVSPFSASIHLFY